MFQERIIISHQNVRESKKVTPFFQLVYAETDPKVKKKEACITKQKLEEKKEARGLTRRSIRR